MSAVYLSENWLVVMRDNGGEVTVQNDSRVVKRLLRMFQQDVELRHAAFKHAPEVTRYECTTYGCTDNKTCYVNP